MQEFFKDSEHLEKEIVTNNFEELQINYKRVIKKFNTLAKQYTRVKRITDNMVLNQAKLQDNLGVSPGMCARWVRLTYNKALNKSIQSYCCAHNAALHAINASTDSSNIIPGAAVFSYRSASGKIDGNSLA